jgi:hypothetical protein
VGRNSGITSDTDGWTISTLKLHNDTIEQWRDRFDAERDRRYTEVNIEKEKALKIKETADLAALSLARESQTYKEQQNDALRDKNLAQSGIYATNESVAHAFDELNKQLKPVFEFVVSQQGGSQYGNSIWQRGGTLVAVLAGIIGVIYTLSKFGA